MAQSGLAIFGPEGSLRGFSDLAKSEQPQTSPPTLFIEEVYHTQTIPISVVGGWEKPGVTETL